ncbi:MAG: HlyC/CorC family transporter [Planctomycetes bacterium]|nr:HlyC/CorC family transporter [Planctomycetota bacterium]
MSPLGWILCLVFIFTMGAMFFAVSTISLRVFSHVKLLEAFKSIGREKTAEKLIDNCEKLILVSSFYRMFFSVCSWTVVLVGIEIIRPGNLTVQEYIWAFVCCVVIFMIFVITIPNAWAKYSSEKILSRTYNILMFFILIAWPVTYLSGLSDLLVRRLAGVVETTPEEEHEERQEEFLSGLEMRKNEGVVDEEEQEMIENVLELSETAADEIMTPRTDVVAIEVNSDLDTVLDAVIKAGHSRVPVYKENIDNIVGVVYAKDMLTEIGKDKAEFRLKDKLRDAYFVPETKLLRVLLHEFQNQKLHMAVVLDEYGGTAGIVTLEDILEELVGEITDEYENVPAKKIRKINEQTIEVDARVYIDDLNDEFDIKLPEEEDYDTVGGFVFSHLGYIPKALETFEYENLKFTISAAEARKVKRIRIEKLRKSEDAD